MDVNSALPHYSIELRPNCSLPQACRLGCFLLIASVPLTIALGLTWVGAWLVLPFAGVELLVLGWAFYQVSCHAGDFERITIDNDKLTVETRVENRLQRHEFQRYWARVVLSSDAWRSDVRLALRSHGREIEIGRHLVSPQRVALGRQLERYVGN
ncbi:MAG: DUF2244 domain-containing protein [Burkholderiales bacterium]